MTSVSWKTVQSIKFKFAVSKVSDGDDSYSTVSLSLDLSLGIDLDFDELLEDDDIFLSTEMSEKDANPSSISKTAPNVEMTTETYIQMMFNETSNQDLFVHTESVDRLISQDFLKLSVRERNVIDEEVHAISTLAPLESPEFLEAALIELSRELEALPPPSKVAYLESQIFPETYVNGSEFRLRFLRCELFDASKAALRMVRFLDLASELFGPQVLQRPPRLTDLTKEEQRDFLVGNSQVLPYRDRAGRAVCTLIGDFGNGVSGTTASRFRIGLYLQYALSDDVETQRKGTVLVIWPGPVQTLSTRKSWNDTRNDWDYNQRFGDATPLRMVSSHFCMPNKPFFHAMRFLSALICDKKSRMKNHIGERIEMMYKLKTYGIPVEFIPITDSDKIKTTYLKQWVRVRKIIEDERESGIASSEQIVEELVNYIAPSSTPSIIALPGSTDVLFRGGHSLLCHPGNFMFQGIVESRLQEHSTASRNDKIAICHSIIRTVKKEKGGRFLTWDTSGGWTILEDESKIYAKVAEKLRRDRKAAARARQQQNCSSTDAFQNQDLGKRRKLSDGNADSYCFFPTSRA